MKFDKNFHAETPIEDGRLHNGDQLYVVWLPEEQVRGPTFKSGTLYSLLQYYMESRSDLQDWGYSKKKNTGVGLAYRDDHGKYNLVISGKVKWSKVM